MPEWIDVSMPIHAGMIVWPGDRGVSLERACSIERGDLYNLTECQFSAHTGTHIDAPLHFMRDGAATDSLPLDALLGPARVIRVENPVAISPADLPPDLERGERILFQTENSFCRITASQFQTDFVYLSKEAAQVLVTAGVRCVGIDYLSVGGYSHDLVETHLVLLGSGVWIIEGLDLSGVEAGRFELVCLPLKLVGAEGSPARAALRQLPLSTRAQTPP
jgi:arylformamidase